MDLPKTYDFIPQELLIAKLEEHGFKKNALKLVYATILAISVENVWKISNFFI